MVLGFGCLIQANYETRQQLKDGSCGEKNLWMQVNGITQVISEVYYIPELKSNLLSMGQLQEKGVSILIKHKEGKVFHLIKGLTI
jgi:hypothetical protein